MARNERMLVNTKHQGHISQSHKEIPFILTRLTLAKGTILSCGEGIEKLEPQFIANWDKK